LLEELRHIANEPNCADIIKLLEEEKLLHLYSPDLAGAKLNHPGLQKLQKARQLVPFGMEIHLESVGLFLYFLTEKLPVKDRAAFIKNVGLSRREVDLWQKLEGKAKKLERDLKSAKLQKPSKVYQALTGVPGDQILFLLAHSTERLVHDRIKNYLQKYLPSAQEVTERDVLATGARPGTPKFQKVREEMILTKLDARPKKIPPPLEAPPTGPGAAQGAGGPGRPPGPGGPGRPPAPGGPGRPPAPGGPARPPAATPPARPGAPGAGRAMARKS
jgi:hypothetical protein